MELKNNLSITGVSSTSTSQSLPEEILFIDDGALRQELRQLGDQPGPITNTTRQLYQKRLLRLRNIKDVNLVSSSNLQNAPQNQTSTKLSNKIRPHLEFGDWLKEASISRICTARSVSEMARRHIKNIFYLSALRLAYNTGSAKS